jgi:hypothetical protein
MTLDDDDEKVLEELRIQFAAEQGIDYHGNFDDRTP